MDFDIFCRNVTDKVGNQKRLYYATSLPGKPGKRENHIFTQLDCVTHTMHLCAVFLKENVVICETVICLMASNIC